MDRPGRKTEGAKYSIYRISFDTIAVTQLWDVCRSATKMFLKNGKLNSKFLYKMSLSKQTTTIIEQKLISRTIENFLKSGEPHIPSLVYRQTSPELSAFRCNIKILEYLMDTIVEQFQNRDNFVKFQMFYYETGTSVIIQTLRWLYVGQIPIETYLVGLAETKKIPRITNQEIVTLLKLRNGTVKLNELDLTLLYKLIQNVCGLAPTQELWNSQCSLNRQDSLEYLLFTLKNGRNDLAHPSASVKNITDAEVESKYEEMKILLKSIIKKAGRKANIDTTEIQNFEEHIDNDLERIKKDKHAAESILPSTEELIIRDVLQWLDEHESTLSYFFQPVVNEIEKFGEDTERLVLKIGDSVKKIAEPICEEVTHIASQIGVGVELMGSHLAQEAERMATEIGQEAEHIVSQIGAGAQLMATEIGQEAEHMATEIGQEAERIVSQIGNFFRW